MAEPSASKRSELPDTLGPAVADILSESPTLGDATARLLARIGVGLGWEMGAIWVVDEGAGVLRCLDTWQAPEVDAQGFDELSRSTSFAPGAGLPGRVWAKREPAWITDVGEDPNFPRARAASQAGLRGAFAVPIAVDDDDVLGVIEFFSLQARQPDPDLLDVMTGTARRIAEFMERREAEESLRRSEELQASLLDSALDCVIAIDHEGRIIEFNPAAEKTFGYRREDAIGELVADLVIPPHLRERHRRAFARRLAGDEGSVVGNRVELTGMRSDGSEFDVELAVSRVTGEDPPKFMATIRDISERKRGQAALQFLVRASDLLDDSLDLKSTLQTLARLTIPYLADGCMVDLRAEDGSIERAASSAADATYEPVLDELRRHPIDPEGPHPIATAMRTGQIELVHDISDSFRRAIAADEDYYDVLQRWPASSVVVAPMSFRGKVLGTLALASFSEERTWGSHELSVISELARRAANTIENARLFEERTRLARTLRESLLPPRLPELNGVEVAARFQPAAAGNELSGDFYDVIRIDDFDSAITIGDVSGRGVEAAATTALARHTIRAVAMHGARPMATLTVLNDALLSQPPELRLCSAVVGLLAIGSAGARLSIANGGHPPPLHLHADGRVEPIVATGTLLGVVSDPDFVEAEVDLALGDSVVFYTDGLIAARPSGHRPGVDELVAVIESCVDLGATVTAASIDQALLEGDRAELRDDAAILVLRILASEGAPARVDAAASGGRRLRSRRAWPRWAARGGAPGQRPSPRDERSDPR